MNNIINIKFISPIGSYKFISEYNYYLVFTGYQQRNIIINKIQINNINNIDEIVRTYIINKNISLPKIQSIYNIKLFVYKTDNTLELLFSNHINLNTHMDKYIILKKPTNINGKNRHVIFKNDTSFLEEVFYNYETYYANDKCIVFLSKLSQKNKSINYSLIDVTTLNQIFVYDKYNQLYIKETIPSKLNDITYNIFNKLLLHNNYFANNYCSPYDHVKYVDYYQIDVNILKKDNISSIDLKYRPIYEMEYKNNIIIAPMDGRYYQTVDSEFKKIFNLPIYNNYGITQIICRNSPQDNSKIFIPYSAYLNKIDNINGVYILKFETDYFISPNINERAYMSVLHGNHIYSELGGAMSIGGLGVGVGAGSRACPETLKVQPDSKLIYYLILPQTKVKLLSHELKWYDIGNELGYFECDKAFIGISSNRIMKLENYIDIDIKIKARDKLTNII